MIIRVVSALFSQQSLEYIPIILKYSPGVPVLIYEGISEEKASHLDKIIHSLFLKYHLKRKQGFHSIFIPQSFTQHSSCWELAIFVAFYALYHHIPQDTLDSFIWIGGFNQNLNLTPAPFQLTPDILYSLSGETLVGNFQNPSSLFPSQRFHQVYSPSHIISLLQKSTHSF